MSDENNPDAPEKFEAEIDRMVQQLNTALGDGASRWHYDEPDETLYIELECIHGLSDEEIEQKAGPIIDRSELDFEEIILLPFEK